MALRTRFPKSCFSCSGSAEIGNAFPTTSSRQTTPAAFVAGPTNRSTSSRTPGSSAGWRFGGRGRAYVSRSFTNRSSRVASSAMVRVISNCGGSAACFSPRNCANPLMAPSGFLISWAIKPAETNARVPRRIRIGQRYGAAPILSPFIDPSPSLKIVPCPQFHLVVILFFTVFAGPPPAEYGSSESQVEIFYSSVVVYWRNVYRKMAVCPIQFGRLNPYLQEVMLIRNDSTAKAGANYCQTARQATHSQRQLTFCSQSKEKGATVHTVTPWFFWWAM